MEIRGQYLDSRLNRKYIRHLICSDRRIKLRLVSKKDNLQVSCPLLYLAEERNMITRLLHLLASFRSTLHLRQGRQSYLHTVMQTNQSSRRRETGGGGREQRSLATFSRLRQAFLAGVSSPLRPSPPRYVCLAAFCNACVPFTVHSAATGDTYSAGRKLMVY